MFFDDLNIPDFWDNGDYKITLVAETFEQFIRGLRPADVFEA
jgi:hypothetical protein